KSRIVMSLIRLAGDSGLRVIALDCDWHRPVLHSFFSRPMAPGLGDLLAGSATPDEVVFQDPDSGVHAIFAGDVGQLSSSVERFARLRLLLGTLTKHYDLVIIDTPPVLAGADAMALAQMTQEVAFVVRWGHTPRDVILDAINHLSLTEARVGGVILSDVDPKRYRRYGSGDAVYGYANMHAMGTA
ncbi:MAG TPA: CpsD/CapB family tyrosine-protein kinase, partial [Alphaproteobacteria bacterium]|nr:CpsD/CapB family tyrosine-protein kinase [Alphaproteobacteria bacterium]